MLFNGGLGASVSSSELKISARICAFTSPRTPLDSNVCLNADFVCNNLFVSVNGETSKISVEIKVDVL